MKTGIVLLITVFLVGTGTAGFADMMMGHQQMATLQKNEMARAGKMAQNDDVGLCPVQKVPASKKYSYEYQGKTYYFCCSHCLAAFKKDPEKYISSGSTK